MITFILALILSLHFGLGWWSIATVGLACVMSAEGLYAMIARR